MIRSKKLKVLGLTALLTLSIHSFSYSGTWKEVNINNEKKWTYIEDNGKLSNNKWIFDNNKWYFIGNDSYMKTGWVFDKFWYFLDTDGSMKTGWNWILSSKDNKSRCYLLNDKGNDKMPLGAMYSNTKTPDEYYVNENGAWVVDDVVQTKEVKLVNKKRNQSISAGVFGGGFSSSKDLSSIRKDKKKTKKQKNTQESNDSKILLKENKQENISDNIDVVKNDKQKNKKESNDKQISSKENTKNNIATKSDASKKIDRLTESREIIVERLNKNRNQNNKIKISDELNEYANNKVLEYVDNLVNKSNNDNYKLDEYNILQEKVILVKVGDDEISQVVNKIRYELSILDSNHIEIGIGYKEFRVDYNPKENELIDEKELEKFDYIGNYFYIILASK